MLFIFLCCLIDSELKADINIDDVGALKRKRKSINFNSFFFNLENVSQKNDFNCRSDDK